jgi:hypothetical protein
LRDHVGGGFILAVRIVLVCLLAALAPATASAQRRVPARDAAAIGGDLGVFLPTDDNLDSGLVLEGFYEYYLSARISMRVGLGWAQPGFAQQEKFALRAVRIPFDIVHNWEGGAIHPFVGAGLGIYFLQVENDGESVGDSDTKLGATLFGGAEFFTGRKTSVKAEARYHIVDGIRGLEPDGLAVTIGLKKYF